MNSSHNGKYFMTSYAISEVRFNDIDDFAKPMICRGILDLDVSHKKLSPITFEVTMQLLDDCSDIDSSFNDLLLTFIDHTRGRLRREHKILLIFPKMFSWLLPYFEITLDGQAKEISNALTNTRLQLVITKGYEVWATTIEG